MLGRRILYLVWSILLCQYYSRCSIFNYWWLVQGTIHLLSGESGCVTCVVSCEFALYTPMVIMVCVQNCVRSWPVNMLRVQGWVGITSACWVSWWLGVRRGLISLRGSEGPQCTGHKLSDYWMFSLTVLQNFSDAFVVALVGTVCLMNQNIVLCPMILHFTWCVALVLIPDFLICHEFLLSHLVCRFLFCFWVVWLGYCLHHSGRTPVCSCSLYMIVLEIDQ